MHVGLGVPPERRENVFSRCRAFRGTCGASLPVEILAELLSEASTHRRSACEGDGGGDVDGAFVDGAADDGADEQWLAAENLQQS